MPDPVPDGNGFRHRKGHVHRQGDRNRHCHRHPETDSLGDPKGDLNRQTDGIADRNSRSGGGTHPNRNL